MAKVTFNTDKCKGCGLCVDACPKKCLAIAQDKLNSKGYSPAVEILLGQRPFRYVAGSGWRWRSPV